VKVACRGFSLLEAVVALAILAGVGVAIFDWVNASWITLTRVRGVSQEEASIRAAMGFLEGINPTAQPKGDVAVGPYRIRWEAVAVEPSRPALTLAKVPGNHEVTLYSVDAEVSLSAGTAAPVHFRFRQAGFRQVRNMWGDEANG